MSSSSLYWLVLSIVCLSLFFSSVIAIKPPYKVCSTAKAHLKIYDIEVNEWPPVSGDTLYVNMTGSVDESVTLGDYTIDITLDHVPLPPMSDDIDKFKPLPWTAGNLSMSFSQDIPPDIANGTLCELQLSAVDQNNQQLFCISMSFIFGGNLMEDQDNQPIHISRPSIHFPVQKTPKGLGNNILSRLAEYQQQGHRHHET